MIAMAAQAWRADPEHEDFADIRASIVDAAWQLVKREGRTRFDMGEVARRAGYSRATLYRYFASKEELVGEAYVAAVERLAKRFRAKIRRYDDPAEQLVEGLLAVVSYVRGRSQIRGDFAPEAHAERMRGRSPYARAEMARALVRPILEVVPLGLEDEAEEQRVAVWLRAIVLSMISGGLSELGSGDEERDMLWRFVVPALGFKCAPGERAELRRGPRR